MTTLTFSLHAYRTVCAQRAFVSLSFSMENVLFHQESMHAFTRKMKFQVEAKTILNAHIFSLVINFYYVSF